jgi:hypothetical protein
MNLSSKILVALTFFSLTANGASFSIDGEIVANDYSINYEIKVPFHLLINSNKWQIQVEFKHYKEFCWSDGVKISSFQLFPQEKGDNALSEGKVLNSVYPLFSDPTVRLVWLAYASSRYFAIDTNTMPALWMMGFLDPVCESYEIINLELLNNQFKLPSKLDFVFSTQYLNSLTNLHYLSKTVSTLKLEKASSELKAYDNSLDGHYEVASITNYNGLIMPLEFKLEVYNMKRGQSEQQLHQRYCGKVYAISSTETESGMPDLPYPLWVDDYRFSDAQTKIDMIGYVVSNKTWPSMDDKKLQTLFKEKKMKQSLALDLPILNESQTRLLPRILIGFTIISLPLLVFLRWIEKGK